MIIRGLEWREFKKQKLEQTCSGPCSFYIILVRVSITVVKHHDQNQHEEERIYFILYLVVHHPGKSGKEFKVGT